MSQTPNGVRNPSRTEFIFLIAALMALNALAIDVMLPALPNMGEALGVASENDRQLVLSMYMLGFGVAQLAFGPLSDRFGRRVPLLAGLAVYLIAAFAAIFAPSYGVLLFLRVVQGMGAAGTRVIGQSIVRDRFAGSAMAEIMSLVFMVFMIMPIIAPAIGQLLLMTGPWWTIFLFMGGLASVICYIVYKRLPETLAVEDQRPLTLKSIIGGFGIVFGNRMAISYSLAGTFLFGAMFGFVFASQQIYVGIFDLGALFPLAFAAVAAVMSLSSFLNSKIVAKIGMRKLSHSSLTAYVILSIGWFALTLVMDMPLWLFFCFVAPLMFSFGWMISNMNSLAMEPLGKVAGTASAVFGFIQTVGGAGIGLFIGRLYNDTLVPIAGGYVVMGILAFICILIAENGRIYQNGTAPLAPQQKAA